MERIKKITEAYSMQPISKIVETRKHGKWNGRCIDKIIIEGEHYVGYNREGSRLFIFLHDSVNVEYFAPGEYIDPTYLED